MAKANKSEQDIEMTAIVTDAVTDAVSASPAISEASKTPKIVIDGVEYDAKNLSAPAKGAIASLQFAEAKLMALHNELAICQTAHFAYVKGLKAELEGKAD
ncbi:DUF6447 family protein [Phaeovulum sp. NW3]|uniref:DUF6447 family protein n=1 Tax=Phaeovulum sp. NW3 TaxID=2934933 RepID=UPI00202123C5|nr:DUF6447 family protein [Phaeovulum sp. NW3]MCL7466101.1 DUF6447 family protein [Phaeovulum sp. NW3]